MNYLDIIILVPLLWGAYKGFRKGLVIALATLVALGLGIYGGIHFSDFMASLLREHLGLTTEFLPVIAFAVVFLGIVIVVHLLGRLIERMLSLVAMNFINKILGSVFSVLKIGLIIGVIIIMLNALNDQTDVIPSDVRQNSLLYQPISEGIELLIPVVEEKLG